MAEVDIASLGVKIDASTAVPAEQQLENLAKTADKTENSTRRVSSATAEMKNLMAQAIAAINSNTQALGSNTDQLNRNKSASRGAAGATDDMESRVSRLRASLDPMGAAIDRVNAELAEARVLFEAGAMSAQDYARAQVVLNARSTEFARRQSMMNAGLGLGARSARLQAHEMLNLSRQFADIGVTAAMGMNPLMILIQQGPQIADVLQTARSRGISTAQAFRQIGESILPWVGRLASIGTVAGVAFGGLALAARGASTQLGDVQAELGLTEKQMDRLKDKGTDLGFTMTDVLAGIGSAIAEAFNLDDVARAWNNMLDEQGKLALDFVEDIVGMFGGMTNAIKEFFNDIPRSVGAVLIATLNLVIDTLNDMVKRGTDVINNLLNSLPDWVGAGKGNLKAFQISNVENPLQDQMDKLSGAYGEGDRSARKAFRGGMRAHRRERILEDAGDPEKGRKPKKSDEEKDWEKALTGAENYIKALQRETEEIGKNRFEIKKLATEREAGELMAAALATGNAAHIQKATELTAKMREETEKWATALNAEEVKKFTRALNDEADQLRFQNSLIGMNAEQRARADKQREIALKILELERDGFHMMADEVRNAAAAVIELTGAQARWVDVADNAARTAENAKDMADAVRDATEGFGELFGTVGEGFSNLITTIFDFQAAQEESFSRLADLQRDYNQGLVDQAEYDQERGRIGREQANNQIAFYGDMLGAAKTYFKEGSTGYRILEGAERAYRLFQFAMMLKHMLLDKVSTVSSVANSGARAAADGVAAVAKAIASLPFPLNIAAGAATLAFLVAIGVKMFGKGGGGGSAKAAASSTASSELEKWSGPTDRYGNPTSYYSVLKPGETTVSGTGNPGNYNAGPGPGAMGGMSFSQQLIVQGSLDSATLPQVQQMLDQSKTDTIQEARQVVARDSAERNSRYRTGG